MPNVAKRMIQAMETFLADIKAGKPVNVTHLRILRTKNGPIVSRWRGELRDRR